jgi:T-complex protein 1 subunit eta
MTAEFIDCCLINQLYYRNIRCENKIFPGHCWYGVDINKEDISDNFEMCVWEPAVVKINALTAACEAACLVLSVDETIKNPKSGGDGPQGPPMGRGMGRPM